MSGLYRCKCVVGYRPYGSSRVIIFSEKQVTSASLNLVWAPNAATLNMQGTTEATQFVSALMGSTANVTLTDPYLTGVAWAALFDSAAAYSSMSAAAANHIMLPACKDGEDPSSGKCFPFLEIDDPRLRTGGFGDFAHILIKLWYEVAGTRFGLDTYFRLQSFNIDHGNAYPRVSLMGVDPQTVTFNQNLVNYKLEENKTLEQNLEKIINDYDYNVSFCNDPTQSDTKRYVMPKSFKEKGVTAEEVIRKYLGSVGGNMLTLPIKEYAKKISICTRANLNQGCSVFYLGKGLYEGYSITGQVDPGVFNQNYQYQTQLGLGFEYDRASLGENEKYVLDNIYPRTRKEKLKNAKTNLLDFDPQFTQLTKRYSENLSSSGFVWRENGPEVTTERRQSTNMYGIGVNGEKPIAMLDGKVVSVSKDGGNVTIGTNYFLRFCKKDKRDCRNKAIYQETQNLTTVGEKIKVGAEVKINEQIGTATTDKPEFVRFYILNTNSSDVITLSPAIVWSYAVPAKALTDEELKNIGLNKTESNSPSGPTPPGQSGDQFAGRVGSTGGSTGPHLHAEVRSSPLAKGEPLNENSDIDPYILIGGIPASKWGVYSRYGPRNGKLHAGLDFSGPGPAGESINGQEVSVTGGAIITKVVQNGSPEYAGYGNVVEVRRPDGKYILLAHLQDEALNKVKTNTVGNGSRYGRGVQSGPAPIGAEVSTEFRGVPRALRIIPGRTILSLITRYDEWVEQGRPAEIDPGIWIAGRFSKWFVKNVRYNWSQGDLRVGITGITDWGNVTSQIKVPTFEEYVQSFKLTGEFEKTNDYYGYIRSLGDLCWKYNETQSSCEVLCSEAQRFQEYFNRAGIGASVTGSFPPALCQYIGTKYPKDRVNAIINAARAAGIENKAAYAGIVGNALAESTTALSPTAGSLSGPYGIFQWLGGRLDGLKSFAISSGKSVSDFDLQMQWFVQELKGKDFKGQETIVALKNTASVEQAAYDFGRLFERACANSDCSVIQAQAKRVAYAKEIFDDLECQAQ